MGSPKLEALLKKLYEEYKKDLYLYNKEGVSELENQEVKKLQTPTDGANFFVVQNSSGIAIVTTAKGSSISLSLKEFQAYLKNQELQHPSYAEPVFDDIINSSPVTFFIAPSNPNNFNIHGKPIGDTVKWGLDDEGKAHSKMKKNDIVFFRISGADNGYIGWCGQVKTVFEDKSWDFEILDLFDKNEKTLYRPAPRGTWERKGEELLAIMEAVLTTHSELTSYSENTPLNQILYGPPGTGKTYHTINMALKIIANHLSTPQNEKNEILEILKKLEQDPSNKEAQEQARQQAKSKFDKYRDGEQIAFVTFHQSYGYEEFVEGIKPNMKPQKNTEPQNNIVYQIEDGVFKKICNVNKIEEKIWKFATLPGNEKDNDYYQECIEEGYIYAENEGKKEIEEKVQEGDYIVIPSAEDRRRLNSIRAFGVAGALTQDGKRQLRKVEWCWHTNGDTSKELKINEQLGLGTFNEIKGAREKILQYFLPPRILIIDEINRGNVSKIFGELITLIEESKRIGAEEELKVTLPYSGKSFGVPQNLYIIGTMNTADRSITALDTALRRRFEFVEMMPEYTLLKEQECEGINLRKMLEAINERIEFLLDREKTIGHAFFIGIDSVKKLKKVFQNKVIPLLQEYFYNDYACIQAVLNDKMIRSKEKLKGSEAFNKFIDDRGLGERVIYEIAPQNDSIWAKKETYKALYDDKNSKDENDQ